MRPPPPTARSLPRVPIAGAAIALLAASASAAPPPPAAPSARQARAVKVLDGDTLLVRLGTSDETVRLLGVDCPEVSHPSRPVEFYAEEAAEVVRSLAEGKTVTLASDPRGDDRDTYNRLLRYVSLPDGRLLNTLLIEEGYCYALTRFQFARRSEFSRLEEAARRRGRRLWEEDGLAEVRWLERGGASPIAIFPMTRQSWGVRFRDRVRARLSGRDLRRTLESLRTWSAELSPRDLDARLEREGWKRLRASP